MTGNTSRKGGKELKKNDKNIIIILEGKKSMPRADGLKKRQPKLKYFFDKKEKEVVHFLLNFRTCGGFWKQLGNDLVEIVADNNNNGL